MIFSATAPVRIPFHDIDVMHIAWHGHYLKYFEIARTALMQKLALDWPALKEQGIAMPVVDTQTKYRKPIVYDQEVIVEASIDEIAYPELIVHYKILAGDGTGEVYSSGRTRQVYMNMAEHNTYFVVPEFVNSRFQAALEKGTGRHEPY